MPRMPRMPRTPRTPSRSADRPSWIAPLAAAVGLAAATTPAICAAQPEPLPGKRPDPEVEPAERTRTYAIAWDWPADPIRYELVRKTGDAIPVPGKDPVTTQTIARVVRHARLEDAEPKAADAGESSPAPVRVTWESIRFEQDDSLNTPLSYDSSDDDQWSRTRHPIIGSIASSVGQSLTLRLAPDGTIAGVESLEGYLRGIESNLTEWGLAGEGTYEQLQMVYTPEAIAGSSKGTYAFMPKTPLAVGDSYEVARPFTLPHVRTLRSAETHTLEAIEELADGSRIARFSIGGTLAWPDPGGMEGQVFNVSLDKVTFSGAWSFDLDRGLVTDYRVEASFLADIVRYDPRDRSSSEMSTRQSLTDTMTLLDPQGNAQDDAQDDPNPDAGTDEGVPSDP